MNPDFAAIGSGKENRPGRAHAHPGRVNDSGNNRILVQLAKGSNDDLRLVALLAG